MSNLATDNNQAVEVFIDESGTITKNGNSRYFIIAMLFTEQANKVRHYFKDRISFLMRRKKLFEDMIKSAKEIKGSDISEAKKKVLYEYISQRLIDEIELGIIVLDNQKAEDRFIVNHARAFNYMLQVYFNKYFRTHSKFMHGKGDINLVIDEQNIATNARYMLEDYLNPK